MSKKLEYFLLALGIILLILLTIFLVFRKAKSAQLITNPADEVLSFPILAKDAQSIIYFSKKSNSLKNWDLKNNQVGEILALPFQNTDNIDYSSDLSLALIHWANPENAFDAHTWLLDLNQKKLLTELSINILTTAWSPDSKKIAYHYFDWDNNINNIAVSNPDGTNFQTIANIKNEDVSVLWYNNNEIIYYEVPSETAPVDIFSADVTSKSVKTIASGLLVSNLKILQGQDKLLLDSAKDISSEYGLSTYNLASNSVSSLDTSSSASKSVQIGATNLIYAVKTSSNKRDTLEEIDTNTNNSKPVSLTIDKTVDQGSLMYNSTDGILYFTSSGNLYRAKLK